MKPFGINIWSVVSKMIMLTLAIYFAVSADVKGLVLLLTLVGVIWIWNLLERILEQLITIATILREDY